jgi:hypothetical protein
MAIDGFPDYRPSPMDAANLLRLVDQEALVALAQRCQEQGSILDHDRIVSTVCLVREALAVLDASIGQNNPDPAATGVEDYLRIKALKGK